MAFSLVQPQKGEVLIMTEVNKKWASKTAALLTKKLRIKEYPLNLNAICAQMGFELVVKPYTDPAQEHMICWSSVEPDSRLICVLSQIPLTTQRELVVKELAYYLAQGQRMDSYLHGYYNDGSSTDPSLNPPLHEFMLNFIIPKAQLKDVLNTLKAQSPNDRAQFAAAHFATTVPNIEERMRNLKWTRKEE